MFARSWLSGALRLRVMAWSCYFIWVRRNLAGVPGKNVSDVADAGMLCCTRFNSTHFRQWGSVGVSPGPASCAGSGWLREDGFAAGGSGLVLRWECYVTSAWVTTMYSRGTHVGQILSGQQRENFTSETIFWHLRFRNRSAHVQMNRVHIKK